MAINIHITELVDEIVRKYKPAKIYLISHKQNLSGVITSFKLCVVCDVADGNALEHDMYLTLESELPFDVVVYTIAEWGQMSASEHSFAAKIIDTGIILYEQE